MKKLLLLFIFLLATALIVAVYIWYIRYKDSLELEWFLNHQTIEWIDYHERTWFKINTKNKNSFLDIFYIPITSTFWDSVTVKVSEYDENYENIDFSFWWLDSVNATTWWTIHFYTKETLLWVKEFRYPYPSSPFLILNEDKSVTLNLREKRVLYNRDSWRFPSTHIYNINWKITWIYVVSRHPTNRYLEFEII